MKPTIINLGSYDVYVMAQVETILAPERYAAFQQWLVGQTLARLDDGRTVCFRRDYDRFVALEKMAPPCDCGHTLTPGD